MTGFVYLAAGLWRAGARRRPTCGAAAAQEGMVSSRSHATDIAA